MRWMLIYVKKDENSFFSKLIKTSNTYQNIPFSMLGVNEKQIITMQCILFSKCVFFFFVNSLKICFLFSVISA